MKSQLIFVVLIAIGALIASHSSVKSQQPVVVQAANGVTATSSPAGPVAPARSSTAASPEAFVIAIRTLEQIKSGNAEVLKRQEATLQQLDQLQQAAEELKIFSKRG
jgi:hypothetical protein